jgi:glycine/D-amino acid oxidase-like deaminating enzyme
MDTLLASALFLGPVAVLRLIRKKPRAAVRKESIWLAELDSFGGVIDTLPREKVDIVIIGAGMSGVSIAYHLGLMGKSCLVLEQRQISGGATGRNAGMLWPYENDEFELKTAQKMMAFVAQNMDVEKEALVNAGGGVRLVKRGAFAKGKEVKGDREVAAILPGLDNDSVEGGYRVFHDPSSTSIFPGRIVHALGRAAAATGATFMEYVTVQELTKLKNGIGQRVHTDRGYVDAEQVVVATNALMPVLLEEIRPCVFSHTYCSFFSSL